MKGMCLIDKAKLGGICVYFLHTICIYKKGIIFMVYILNNWVYYTVGFNLRKKKYSTILVNKKNIT